MAAVQQGPGASQPTSRNNRTAALRRLLKATPVAIRHIAATIGWASHIWFNVTLPLAILLAGLAIMAGLVFLSLVTLAPDSVQSIPDFRYWVYPAD